MPLDLEPVLDLEPIPKLDLQPVPEAADRTMGSQLAVKIPEVMREWNVDFPKEMPGLSASEVGTLNSLKRDQVLQEAQRRVKESPGRSVARGAQRFGAGLGEASRDPANLALMGLTAAVPPVGAAIMTGIAEQAISTGAGKLSVPGGADTAEATQEMLNMALMGSAAAGTWKLKGPPSPRPSPPGEGGSGALSEFGGETDLPPPSNQPGAANAVPGANGEAVPTPEAPKTLESQLAWLKEGKRQAVLVTPGAEMPAIPDGMEGHPTAKGTFIFNPETVNPAIIDAHVAGNTVGDLLGYGISDKPADASAVVTVRDGQGIEKQAVVTDQASLPKVLEAAKGVADKSDTVQVEPAEKVIEDRQQSAILNKVLNESIYARQPVPEKLAQQYEAANGRPIAWPEGYKLEGENFVYTEPERKLTPQEQMVRENQEAMRKLSEAKKAAAPAEETALTTEAQRHREPRTAEPTPEEMEPNWDVGPVERPPDILDWINDNYPEGVKFTKAEFADYVRQYKTRLKELKPKQRRDIQTWKRNDFLRSDSGSGADAVLDGMHREGIYRRIESEDDLADAMLRAMEQRLALAKMGAQDLTGRWMKEEYSPSDVNRALQGREQPGDTAGRDNGGARGQAEQERVTPPEPASALQQARSQTEAGPAYAKELKRLALDRLRGEVRMLEDDLRWATGPRAANVFEDEGWQLRRDTQYPNAQGEPMPRGLPYTPEQLAEQALGRQKLAERTRPKLEAAQMELARREAKLRGELIRLQENPRWVELQRLKEKGLQRIQEAAEQSQIEDRVLNWLNRAIEATNADPTKQLEGVTGAPVWLAKGAANAVLRVTKAVYTTTRDLAKAIAAGIEHLRSLKVEGFDEGQARQWLEGTLGERETGQKILASDATSEETKAAVNEYLYQRRTNATDQQLADGMVRDLGVDAAVKIFQDPPSELPGAVRSKLLGTITRTLAEQERQARAGGDTAAADGLAQRQAAIWDDALPRVTDLAQSLQALNDLVELSPDAQVARLKNKLERQANDALDARRDELDLSRKAIEEGRAAGIEQLKQDPAVNEAAKGAVNQAIEQSPDIQKAVVMEMAEPWASSSEVMKAAREQVRLKANELLNKAPRPPQLSPSQHLHALLDDLAKRAATIFAGHLQGAEPHLTIVDKLMQRLGLERSRAVSLATALSKEWERQLKAAQAAIPKRIATQRVARERAAAGGLPEGAPDRLVDAAIRKQLRDLNVKLGEVLKQETERQDATGQHVAERVVQASGLTGEKADTLRTTLTNRWNTLVTGAQRAKLEALQKNTGVTLSGPLKSAFQKLTELERLGALTSEKFFDVVKQSLKLKQLTKEDAGKLRELVQKAQAQPEGFLRARAAADVMKFTEHLSGNVSWRDVPMAIFYANILSGVTTPAKVVFENMNLLVGNTVMEFLGHPVRHALHPLDFARETAGAFGRGVKAGAVQGADILRTGVTSGIKPEMQTRQGVLEMKPFGEKLEPLNFWKYFMRLISAVHVSTFAPAWEVKSAMIARDVAAREGLTGAAARQRVADLLANTKTAVAEARAKAAAELPDGPALDVQRRTREHVLAQREANMPGSTETARDFALRTTYLNEPYGMMGLIAGGVRSMLEQARKQFPVMGTAVKTQIPFTTIVANILNEKLNWTPVGAFRAAVSHGTGELYGRPMMEPGERAQLYTKAIVGTIALGALAELFGQHIHGNGPGSPQQRKQLQAAGWIPHSIEIGGKYFSYMNTPAAVGLAVVGNWLDWHRYGKGEGADAVSRTAFAAKATANAIVSQGMLDSVRRIFEAVGNESSTEGADQLQKLVARTASSAVIPNAVQQLDRIFDPTVYDKTGIEALVKGQIPFVRRDNKPALTVLGDKVESGPFHYWASQVTEDPLLRVLAEKQAWVPEPGRHQIVGDKKRGPEYFRALTPEEFYDFVNISGREIRRRLQENLDVLATSEPLQAQKLVQKIAEEEHRKAKENFK